MENQKTTKNISLIIFPLLIVVAFYSQISNANETDETTGIETQTHTIKAQNRMFNPDIIYINPGDTVAWESMLSHNTLSIERLIPEGVPAWRSEFGDDFSIQLDAEGIYAYECQIHARLGMVGIIVVGKPTDLEQVKQYAAANLQESHKSIIDKLNNVEIP